MARGKSVERTFAVCVDNRGYAASLELRKIYRVVSDAEASALGQVRIIDESGEDYLRVYFNGSEKGTVFKSNLPAGVIAEMNA